MAANLASLPGKYLLEHQIYPLIEDAENARFAAAENLPAPLIHELQFLLAKKVEVEIWPKEKLSEALLKFAPDSQAAASNGIGDQFEHVDKSIVNQIESAHLVNEDQVVIQLVNTLISEAIRRKASDIHLESYEDDFRIRLRIDGKLQIYPAPEKRLKNAVISRLKIMADMDIAEKRRPQDGRIRMKSSDRFTDIRASTLPTDFGEKMVLRILDKSALNLSLENLGMPDDILEKYRQVLSAPYGMVLVTGPTGSGKTTTLYAGLNYINRPDINILTIEDPIEYNLGGINQTMVKPSIGLTFAAILRTALRQDPNTIMLGEIRDSETAEIAIRASLTGHLLLSTLHTNDAISTITRLIDMKIPPFLLAGALKLILSQRLVRKICPDCKTPEKISGEMIRRGRLPRSLARETFYKGAGCENCNFSGYRGREAVVEALVIDETFSENILSGSSPGKLRAIAKEKGIRSLFDAALDKARQGITSISEVLFETGF